MKGENPLLFYRIREPKIKKEKTPLLILMHGVGSNESHMQMVGEHILDEFLVVSARAPYANSESSFRWFAVDFINGVPKINAEEAEKSRIIINQFINQLKELHEFDPQSIYLGGFSQGAIMSYSVGLTHPEKIKGIIGMSGRILKEIRALVKTSEKLKQEKVLLIHGTKDQVLPIHFAREAKEYLEELEVKLDYHETDYDHTVNSQTISIINDWLRQQ